MSKNWGNDHLVIPDAHAHPEVTNERFDWLGKLILDLKPKKLICVGDFGDFQSLSSYDKGKKTHENKRYWRDVLSTNNALWRVEKPIADYNAQRVRNKKAMYLPERWFTEGNHEERIQRVVHDNAELDGVMSRYDMDWHKYGYGYIGYKSSVLVDGVMYSHNFASGPLGRPIGGQHLGYNLLQKNQVSSTVGHDHRLSYATQTRIDGRRMYGLSAGCFIDPRHMEIFGFAKSSYHMWWSGVVHKKNVTDGDYDVEFISFDQLMKEYGE